MRLSRSLACVALLSVLGVACTMRQTNQLPGDTGGGGATSQGAQQPSQPAPDNSSSSGDDASTGDAAPSTPVKPPADAAPTQPAVSNFTLINVDTNMPIAGYDPIPEGSTITLANLPSQNLNIRANVEMPTGTTIGSVSFDFDGTAGFHVENAAPYALGSDNNGTYLALNPPLAAGAHTLTATPFSDAAAAGTAFTAKTVHFTVQ